ncbi:MAG: N-6 DNA methylase [Acidimicrobiales bacterium]
MTPPAPSRADGLIAAHQATLGPDDRARGAVYTPRPVADVLVGVALAGLGERGGPPGSFPAVCDPAVGGGTFLLAAADALVARGRPPVEVVGELLWGADVDPAAVAVARRAVAAWLEDQRDEAAGAGARRAALAALDEHVVVADSLAAPVDVVWPRLGGRRVATVVGNPPFQDQLATATARSAPRAAELRARLGDVVGGYTDSAALFLVAALDLVAPGGRVVLVQPQSVLAGRDARATRAAVAARTRIEGLWVAGDHAFPPARVPAVAVVARRPGLDAAGGVGVADRLARWLGPDVAPAPAREVPAAVAAEAAAGGAWSSLVVDLLGVPPSGLPAEVVGAGPEPHPRSLASLATATAGFRDEYYGVAPFVREATAGEAALEDRASALVTSGAIAPGRSTWGERPIRFARRRWSRPVVDVEAVRAAGGRLAAWADRVLCPKVVLATQTRVLEAAVDREGSWWPSVPVIAVVPHDTTDLDRVAAVLLAPPVSAWAHERTAGAALSSGALKLAARQAAAVPLPVDEEAWWAAAALVPALADPGPAGRAALHELGAHMVTAYRAGDDVLAWWRHRLG